MSEENPVILVYRRTHIGDPSEDGCFGCHDCMKSVRDWKYGAVIGIGGSKPDPGSEEIKERITWIGIGPREVDLEWVKRNPNSKGFGGKIYTFDKFKLMDKTGPLVVDIIVNNVKAGSLYKYMFIDHKIPRAGKNFQDKIIYPELKEILKLADNAPPSAARNILHNLNTINSKCSASNKVPRVGGCI